MMPTKTDQITKKQVSAPAGQAEAMASPRKRYPEHKLLLIFVLFSAGIIAAGSSFFWQHKKTYTIEAHRQLSAITEMKVRELVQWREDKKADAAIFFKNPSFFGLVRRFLDNPDDTHAQRHLKDWVITFSTTEDFDLISLLDTQGVVRLCMPDRSKESRCEHVSESVEALTSGQIIIQDFHRHQDNQQVYLAVWVPIFDETDAKRPLGVLSLRIVPEKYLFPFLEKWPMPSATAETQLVRRDGSDVVFLSGLRDQANASRGLRVSLKNNEILAVKAALGQTGILSGVKDYRGVPVIAAIQAVPNSPWVLVAKMDKAELMAPLYIQFWELIMLILSLLLVLGVGVRQVWRHQAEVARKQQTKNAEAARDQEKAANQRLQQEITEHKAAEEALQASEEHHRLLLQYLPVGVVVHARDTSVLFANQEAELLLGLSNEVMQGKKAIDPAWHLVREDGSLLPSDEYPVSRVLATGKPLENLLLGVDRYMRGDRVWLLVNAFPQLDEAGQVQQVDVTLMDLTERKRTESYREMRREIIQLLNEPGDLPDVLQRVISAVKTTTGFDAVGLRLQDGEDFPYYSQDGFPPEFLVKENTLLERGADGGICRDKDGNVSLECTCGLIISGTTDPTSPLFTKGGSFWTNDSLPFLDLKAEQDPRHHPRNTCIHEGYLSVALIPVKDKGQIIGLIHLNDRHKDCFTLENVELLENIAVYIGEALMRRKAEEALHEMAESKAKFASTVAHELRSPLAMIKESTNIIMDEIMGPLNIEQKEMLRVSKNNIERLGRLINNVLALQKINAKKMDYDLQEHDVNDVVKEAHTNAMLFAGERNADVMMELGAEIPRIKFDADKIMQVLINLLANAIKYSENGPVVIQTRLANNEVQISVRDSGQGINPEELDEIFKPFVQGKGRKKGGTGLGLAITKEIVLAHHGRIWVESEVGKGSTFYFALPVGQVGQV